MLDNSYTSSISDQDFLRATTDMDKISKVVADTYDQISLLYKEKHFNDFVLNNPLEIFIRHLKQQNEDSIPHVLDIGCGPGLEARYLATRGFKVIGIDASQQMINLAKQAAPKSKTCKFKCMKMQDLQFYETAFDGIWCSRALIHVPQALVVDLLASWKRILKVGGILGISVIVGKRKGWGQEDYDPRLSMFNRYFAENELSEALEANGFSIIDHNETIDRRDTDNPVNLFLLAQKLDTHLDCTIHSQELMLQNSEAPSERDPINLERIIATYLHVGVLNPREQVNLCVLYDKLAAQVRTDPNRYKLAAQKLKLHLQTPETLSSKDFCVWFTFGQLHLKLTQFRQAISCLEKARRLKPEDIPTLLRLSFSYEGLREFDKAIEVAHEAERCAELFNADDETKAELYHALGHFYVGRSHIGHEQVSVSDRETGERYMELACNTGKKGFEYLGCLGSIYNEAQRYPETIRLLNEAISMKQVIENEELYNDLYFYRGEAFMGIGRYESARADFERIEFYAHEKCDWDSVALVRLYKTRMNLKRKNVNELELDELDAYFQDLYEYEPSPYMVESFQRDRERLLSILHAFHLLRQCLDEQEPLQDFNIRLGWAIEYMEKVYEDTQKPRLDWLVLADNPGKVRGEVGTFAGSAHLYGLNELEEELTEHVIRHYPIWGLFVLDDLDPLSLARISFLIGRFYLEGHIIYIYDPKHALPKMIRTTLEHFFVESIDDVKQLSYACLLYNKIRDYLSSTITPLGMAPLGVTPSLLAAQAENIDLLPQGEICS